MAIHNAVCEAMGVDDFSFRYSSTPNEEGVADRSRSFLVNLERREGRGGFQIVLDKHEKTKAVRFLQVYTWPPSGEHVVEDMDAVTEAVFGALPGEWQRVLVETRLRGQVQASGNSALEYLRDRVLSLPTAGEKLETPINFLSVSFETPPGHPSDADQLYAPKREFKLEILREDERSLYVELMSQWAQLATQPGPTRLDALRIRELNAEPSQYVKNSLDYLTETVFPIFEEATGGA